MASIEGDLKLKLDTSNSQIEALNDEIAKTAFGSRVLGGNQSWNWSALNKVAHPSLETKEESSKEMDPQLERMIEKEISSDDFEITKL